MEMKSWKFEITVWNFDLTRLLQMHHATEYAPVKIVEYQSDIAKFSNVPRVAKNIWRTIYAITPVGLKKYSQLLYGKVNPNVLIGSFLVRISP